MRLGRGHAERRDLEDDPADMRVTSERGWVRVDADLRRWIPCPFGYPDGMDLDSWATAMATAWWEQSGLDYDDSLVGQLAAMLRAIHESGYGLVRCHQIWIYLPDPGTAPLPVFIGIWKQGGERDRRLRLLTDADDRSAVRKPQVDTVTTPHLGTGLRVVRHLAKDKGHIVALLVYAFRVEEYETDIQVFTSAQEDLHALANAGDEIERLVQGITVYRNTDELREP